ncbi:hypothetical protein QBC32DRAFT_313169 [Pseudoneurospora amorphoporcata]|uniref:Uncharacterized protein n=1 Tax=Pseudoneurospora amorphoporcata TaxID=241081 RepID=A0AAN6NZX4_9PEZI|nr:hypothetical protein QBC32DRAFT_313169 [Pseudoneurospora amorphoporcata]
MSADVHWLEDMAREEAERAQVEGPREGELQEEKHQEESWEAETQVEEPQEEEPQWQELSRELSTRKLSPGPLGSTPPSSVGEGQSAVEPDNHGHSVPESAHQEDIADDDESEDAGHIVIGNDGYLVMENGRTSRPGQEAKLNSSQLPMLKKKKEKARSHCLEDQEEEGRCHLSRGFIRKEGRLLGLILGWKTCPGGLRGLDRLGKWEELGVAKLNLKKKNLNKNLNKKSLKMSLEWRNLKRNLKIINPSWENLNSNLNRTYSRRAKPSWG